MPAVPTLRELESRLARACLDVCRFIQRDLGVTLREKSLLLAVSGGADSLALLTILALLRPQLGCALRVLHVDHRLRPESSKEARLVADRCAAWDIPCAVRAVDVGVYAAAHALGVEDAGRKIRYALLEEERRRVGADWILTGHHRDDLEEDVLLRLIRGVGWPALGGMAAVDRRRRVLRPLLLTAPEILRALLRACGLPWAEDSSNADTRYRRNRLRHDVIPLLRRENPSLHRSICTVWQLAREDQRHWETLLDAAVLRNPPLEDADGITLPRSLLRGLDGAGRLRLYLRVLRQLQEKTGHGQARAETLLALDAAWRDGRGGTRFQLPGGSVAMVRRGSVRFAFRL